MIIRNLLPIKLEEAGPTPLRCEMALKRLNQWIDAAARQHSQELARARWVSYFKVNLNKVVR